MDKYKVMWYLLSDFTKYGIAYPKKAKEIAVGADIDLAETYATLEDLREKGLIWRVGKKYKYRYGLKEGLQLDNLVQIYNSLALGLSLPSYLRIGSEIYDKLQNQNELNKDIIQRLKDEQETLLQLSISIKFLSQEERKDTIEKCINRIIQYYSKTYETSNEEILDFLKKEFYSILLPLFGVRQIGVN